MRYTTNYDIGDRKRGQGINEDSLSVTVFEQGHRDGYLGKTRPPRDGASATGATDAPGDGPVSNETGDPDGAEPADVAAAIDEAERDTGAADEAPEDRAAAGDDAEAADDEEPELPANRSAGVFVLADGAGGHDAGDVASYIATTVVAENLTPVAINAVRSRPEEFDIDINPDVLPEPLGAEDIQTGLENAIIKAHREVIRYADDSGTQSYTTVVAGVYADGWLHLGWVGDSRVYLVNDAREEIVPLTKDHAVVEEWADQGEIDAVEAHVHPDGNQITRALGGSGHEDPDRAMVEVDTRSVQLFAEDTVLATSDGLIDAQTDATQLYHQYVEDDRSEEMAEAVLDAVVTDEEIRDVLLSASSLDDAAAEYIRIANDRGGKDNISVLLFEDETLPPTPSGGIPVRAADPDIDLSERETVIITED